MTLILCLESSWFEISFIKIFSIGELLTWKSPTKFPFEMWKIIIIHWKWMNKTYREMRDSRLDYIQSTGDCPLLCVLTSQLQSECSENMTQQLCLCLATPRPPSNQHWHWYLLIAPTEQSGALIAWDQIAVRILILYDDKLSCVDPLLTRIQCILSRWSSVIFLNCFPTKNWLISFWMTLQQEMGIKRYTYS